MEEPGARLEVGGSVGGNVVAGNHNVINYGPAPVFTVAMLGGLTRHTAASQVLEMGHREAVLLLAEAPTQTAAEVLDIVWSRDPDRALELLSDIERGRATAIIATMVAGAALARLPEAVEAIARREIIQPPSSIPPLGARVGRIRRASPSRAGTLGYVQAYEHGAIYWNARDAKATPVVGEAWELLDMHGGTGGELGFPFREPVPVSSASGTSGWSMGFDGDGESSGDYLYSSPHGTFVVRDAGDTSSVAIYYELHGHVQGWLGFPISAATATPYGHIQRFEGGVLHQFADRVVAVRADIAAHIESRHGEASLLPVADEETATSPLGTVVRSQKFGDHRGNALLVLQASDHGLFPLALSILAPSAYALYERLGGPAGRLGAVVERHRDVRVNADKERRACQRFEDGFIYYGAGVAAVAMSIAVGELFLSDRSIGYPVAPERALVDEDGVPTGDKIQFFERAVITVRSGIAEAWPAKGRSEKATRVV